MQGSRGPVLAYLSSLILGTPTPPLPQVSSKPAVEQFWISFRSQNAQGSFMTLSYMMSPLPGKEPFLSPAPTQAVSYRKPPQVAGSKPGWVLPLYPLPMTLQHTSH